MHARVKTRKLIGIFFKNFYKFSNQGTSLKLYKYLIRPHLDVNASAVWSPQLAKDIKIIEDVQELAWRICTKKLECQLRVAFARMQPGLHGCPCRTFTRLHMYASCLKLCEGTCFIQTLPTQCCGPAVLVQTSEPSAAHGSHSLRGLAVLNYLFPHVQVSFGAVLYLIQVKLDHLEHLKLNFRFW